MKNFNNYIKNKQNAFNKKVELIKPIVDFIKKYKLNDYVIIGNDNDNYHYDEITISEKSLILTYEAQDSMNKSIRHKTELFDLDVDFLTNLVDFMKKTYRLDHTIIFEIYREYDIIVNAFKVTKEKLNNFSHFSFLEWMDVDDLKEEFPINSYKFQKTVFSTHPEVFNSFMDAIKQQMKNIADTKTNYDYEELILHPKIAKEYKDLLYKYNRKEKSKDFNL